MTSQCWRTAKSCHVSEASTSSSGSKGACQAWYRCESAGDYVIKWRCNKGDPNATASPLQLCTEQQQKQAADQPDCPPPVVCASDPYEEEFHVTNDLSGDLILAIALASFAVLAVMLIMASTYKYCKIRKRRQRRPHQPRHLFVRDCPYPVRYHHLWGASPHVYDVFNKKTTSSPVYSGPFPDVYFSKPCESSRKFEHLLSSSDDSLEDFPVSKFRHGHAHHNGGKHKTDPSVVTGSFVFHQPGSSVVGAKDKPDSRAYPAARSDVNENGSEESSECYHIYRGNLSRLHHHDHARFAQQQQKRHHGQVDQHHLPDMSAEFIPFPRLSSISIPNYSHQHQGKSSKRKDKTSQDQQLREERTERLPRNSFDSNSSCSGDSHASISPYATGCLDQMPPKVHGREPHHSKKSHRGSPHSNSPDVISGHNVTNAFVRVGMNVYKSLQTRTNSVGSLESGDLHAFENQKKVSGGGGKHAKNHHRNNDNNTELSYDSFRNEHLKALATKGAASSSTLEAGFRHKSHDVSTPTHSRY